MRDTGKRSPERLKEHYEVEKELAARLRRSSREERKTGYAELYDELYRRVPDHPQLMRRSSPEESAAKVADEIRHLMPYLHRQSTFLELGPGDGALAVAVAGRAGRVYAVDVSTEITRRIACPKNLNVILSDGSSVPVPAGTVDLAYRNQLMEHLHPDDAVLQVRNIYNALVPGGVYFCITPNRLSGPHDISKYFDATATGFHLKEYTVRELYRLFRETGFTRVRVYAPLRGWRLLVPVPPVVLCEIILELLPPFLCRRLAASRVLSVFLGIKLIARK
ncbi:MAG: class I SAM-dependent methyltransferase [Acidobacteriota bacterium]